MNEKVRPAFEKTIEVAMRYPMVLTSALIAALSLVTVLELENSDRWFTVLKLFLPRPWASPYSLRFIPQPTTLERACSTNWWAWAF